LVLAKPILRRDWLQACLLAASLSGVSACFSPQIQEGLVCSETQSCPGGQPCTIGVCRSARFGPDARIPDGLPDSNAGCIGSTTFSFVDRIENFTAPSCATIVTIEAFGAQGGGTISDPGAGGKGARIRADFLPSPGAVFRILVGEKGEAGSPGVDFSQGGGTGGGGSFVVDESNAPMLVAGGGGGATEGNSVQRGGPGQVTLDAQNGGGDGAGIAGFVSGTNDIDGGDSYTAEFLGYHGGTGGGGFFTDGFYDSVGATSFGTKNTPGQSFLNGGDGGRGGSLGRNGGYGGGGAAGFTGGGGGGYTGGGAGGPGTDATLHGGGGGGSISSGTNPDSSPGVNSGDGKVIFSWRK
ncbi:MAG: hypothetical protein JKY56_21655, partial [Kofleriaceae bacterium]|nr:hypothetical protein [Kofleriaceae bacterium]